MIHTVQRIRFRNGNKQEGLISHYYLKLERQLAHGCSKKVPDNAMFSVSPESVVTDSCFCQPALCPSSVANKMEASPSFIVEKSSQQLCIRIHPSEVWQEL